MNRTRIIAATIVLLWSAPLFSSRACEPQPPLSASIGAPYRPLYFCDDFRWWSIRLDADCIPEYAGHTDVYVFWPDWLEAYWPFYWWEYPVGPSPYVYAMDYHHFHGAMNFWCRSAPASGQIWLITLADDWTYAYDVLDVHAANIQSLTLTDLSVPNGANSATQGLKEFERSIPNYPEIAPYPVLYCCEDDNGKARVNINFQWQDPSTAPAPPAIPKVHFRWFPQGTEPDFFGGNGWHDPVTGADVSAGGTFANGPVSVEWRRTPTFTPMRTQYIRAWLDCNINGGHPDGSPSWWPGNDGDEADNVMTIKVYIGRADIAMDGNRDGTIDFDDSDDNKYLFWVNDDCDVKHYEEFEWHEDDIVGPADCSDDVISFRRDLEDFTRLHLRVDEVTANTPGVSYYLKFENVTAGAPSVNLFQAADPWGSQSYLENGSVADQQYQMPKLLTIAAAEVQLPNQYVNANGQRSCFILEAASAGKGDLTLILKKDGHAIGKCRKAVTLEIRPIDNFFQYFKVFTVGSNSYEVHEYNPDFVESSDYLLLVHGFNMGMIDKESFPATCFKRLWWQGYKGYVGFFDWPCSMFDLMNPKCYDDSEYNAWRCGTALVNRINQLNSEGHAGKVRLLAHSQGNVVVAEALRQATGQVVHTYIGTQAAVAADCYQAGLASYFSFFETPNVLVHYPLTGNTYAAGIAQRTGSRSNYYNYGDYALHGRLSIGTWEWNNETRPDLGYSYYDWDGNLDTYDPFWDHFYQGSTILTFPQDTHQIFSYNAEARASPLGMQSEMDSFGALNLESLGYDDSHYSHSRQFRSNIIDERGYWLNVRNDCALDHH